jgi:hypothetical protein
VVVSGVDDAVTLDRALFLVGGQLRRSRSAQAVSDAKKTNRIRLLRIVHFVCYFVIATTANTKTVRQDSRNWYSYVVVGTALCMASNCHFLVFAHGPAPDDDVACIAIHCETKPPPTLRSMLNEVVVGTVVNSYATAEPMDFGCVTTIGACVNLPDTKVTVTLLAKLTEPT